MEKIKVVLVRATEESLPTTLTIEDDLKAYQTLIECDSIDIVRRFIGGKQYTIVCDDEGLLKEHPIISAVTKDGIVALVGNLVIAGLPNDEGELTSLTDKDVKEILREIAIVKHTETGKKYYAVKVW